MTAIDHHATRLLRAVQVGRARYLRRRKMTTTIKAVYGQEPNRAGECPSGAHVGYDDVTRIDRREENLGTYGITWFDVFKGDHLDKSYNATAIAEVHYADEAAPGSK